jgi:predicted PurR-regulated permease PerM
MGKGLRRAFAVLVVFVLLLTVLVLFGFSIVPVIGEQVEAMIDAAPELIRDLQNTRWVRELDERFGTPSSRRHGASGSPASATRSCGRSAAT